MRQKIVWQWLLVAGLGALLGAAATAADGARTENGRFINDSGPWKLQLGAAVTARLTTPQRDKKPRRALPLRQVVMSDLQDGDGPVLFRLGHSSILLQLEGQVVLLDPVFSDRVSPVQWAGPKRFHPLPLDPAALPPIKAVVISHDHYDHLDEASIRLLAPSVENFLVPLGVGDHLRRWGIADESIVEFDWWQELELAGITFAATPAQHFSGRGLLDRNRTLWASWVIKSPSASLFFSGDTGYFDGFSEIGERYGPFDITMIENGAYNNAWRDIHMMPEDSMQAHLDLGGAALLPIHNSTFDLSLHAWFEPLEQISKLAAREGVNLLTPVIGAPLRIAQPQPTYAWWRALMYPERERIARQSVPLQALPADRSG